MTRESVWLDCASPGCPNGTYADSHHLANLCAPGGWYCNRHDYDTEGQTA